MLGQFPHAPDELLVSIEVDIFSVRNPAESDLIDGSIGEGSPFHQTFGYYAHWVGADTAVLPDGWRERLIPVRNNNTGGGTWLCIEIHDLAVSKLIAGRENDLTFIAGLLRNRLANLTTVRERLRITSLDEQQRVLCLSRLQRVVLSTTPVD